MKYIDKWKNLIDFIYMSICLDFLNKGSCLMGTCDIKQLLSENGLHSDFTLINPLKWLLRFEIMNKEESLI